MLIGQTDLGSSLLFFTLFVVMLWVATERPAYLAVGGVLFAAGAYAGLPTCSATCSDRVDIWLDPWRRPARATASRSSRARSPWRGAALTGTGLGLGNPTRIPEVQNDFIFAAIGEELGLFGTAAIIICLPADDRRRACASPSGPSGRSSKLLAAGLTTILGVQAFIIIAGVMRVLPLTGVTLPFVSYGGSSLVANYILLALLLRISDTTAQRLGETHRQAGPLLVPAEAEGRSRCPTCRSRRSREQADPPARHRPHRVLHRAVRAAQRDPGRQGRRLQHPADNTRAVVRDFSRPAAASSRPTARCWPRACRRATSSSTSASYPTGDLFAEVTGYFSFQYGTDGVEKQYNDELAGQTATQQVRACSTSSTSGPTSATSRSPCAPTSSRWPRRRSATARARWWPSTPAPARSSPCGATRPTTPTCWPPTTSRPSTAARDALLADPAQAAARRDLPGALLPRLDLQDRHHDRRSRHGHGHAGQPCTRRSRNYIAARHYRPHRELRRTSCGGALLECSAALQHRVRPDGRRHRAPPGMVNAAEEFGFNQTPPIDLPRAGAELLPAVEASATTRPSWPSGIRPERRAGHAAQHGPDRGQPSPTRA